MLFAANDNTKSLLINADMENIPIKNNIFDLALSSMSLQWVNNLDIALNNIYEILKPNSNFIFAIVIDGTLGQLKKSCQYLDIDLAINDFIELKQLEKIVKNSNFQSCDIIKEQEIDLYYQDIYQLLKSIKNIGASYSEKSYFKNDFEI